MGKLSYYLGPVTVAYITFQAKIIETTLEALDLTRNILLGGHWPSSCSTSLAGSITPEQQAPEMTEDKKI